MRLKHVRNVLLILTGLALCFGLAFRFLPVFQKYRDIIVATAITTRTHQWIADLFESKENIRRVEENIVREVDVQSRAAGTTEAASETGRSAADPSAPAETVNTGISAGLAAGTNAPAEAAASAGVQAEPTAAAVAEEKYPDFTELEEGLYLKDVAGTGWAGKLLLVEDPSRVHVAHTKRWGVLGLRVLQMLEEYDAAAGLNGGWFVDPELSSDGGVPTGFVFSFGKQVYPLDEPYPGSTTVVGFTDEDEMVIGKYTQQEAEALGMRDCLATYPLLIVNGKKMIEGSGGWGLAPRSAIAQLKTGEVLMLAIDGRQLHSAGADIGAVQDVLYDNGAYNAICLDGGSSTVLAYDGEWLNSPSLGRERPIPTGFIVTRKGAALDP